MVKGKLYRYNSFNSFGGPFWKEAGPILYLGEDVIERTDGVRIVNHTVLVKGQRRILDRTFLRYLEPLTKA